MIAAAIEYALTLCAIGAFIYLLKWLFDAVCWLYDQLPHRRALNRKHNLAGRWISENRDAAKLLPGYWDASQYLFIEQNFNNDGEPK